MQNEQQSGSEEENFMLIISNYRKKRGKSREFWVLESHFMFVWLAMDKTHVSISLLWKFPTPRRTGHIKSTTPRVSICLDATVASERSTREKKVQEYHNWHHHAIIFYSCAPPGRSSNKRIKLLKSFSFLFSFHSTLLVVSHYVLAPTRPLQHGSKLMIISRAVMRNGREFFICFLILRVIASLAWLSIVHFSISDRDRPPQLTRSCHSAWAL